MIELPQRLDFSQGHALFPTEELALHLLDGHLSIRGAVTLGNYICIDKAVDSGRMP